MNESPLIIAVVGIAVVGLVLVLARHAIYRMFHSPAEICERYGHDPGVMSETSGRGRFGTCERCGASLHEHEWS